MAGLGLGTDCLAVEGGLGHTITGLQVTPFAGIIPPDPGFIWQLGYTYYSGDIGAAAQTPVGGVLALGLGAKVGLATATGVYVWDTPKGRWNFATMLTLPYAFVEAEANAVVGGASISLDDDVSDWFDLPFAPIIASYHVSPLEHWSFAVFAFAPTGSYTPGRLANPGLNRWTVSPTIAYTKLFQQGAWEFTASTALDLNGENDDTDYDSGNVFRLEMFAMRRYANGWGVGLVGAWLEQVSEDEGGALTEVLDGFEGRALGLGPALNWKHKTGGGELDFNFRWVPEFEVEKRFDGASVMATLGLNF